MGTVRPVITARCISRASEYSRGRIRAKRAPRKEQRMPQRRYLKPSWLISRVANPLLMRLRVVPTLRVRGRTTGQWRSVPVNVLELDGEQYLVSARGRRTGSETC